MEKRAIRRGTKYYWFKVLAEELTSVPSHLYLPSLQQASIRHDFSPFPVSLSPTPVPNGLSEP